MPTVFSPLLIRRGLDRLNPKSSVGQRRFLRISPSNGWVYRAIGFGRMRCPGRGAPRCGIASRLERDARASRAPSRPVRLSGDRHCSCGDRGWSQECRPSMVARWNKSGLRFLAQTGRNRRAQPEYDRERLAGEHGWLRSDADYQHHGKRL